MVWSGLFGANVLLICFVLISDGVPWVLQPPTQDSLTGSTPLSQATTLVKSESEEPNEHYADMISNRDELISKLENENAILRDQEVILKCDV